ncbi:hypothetical protein [Falsarthrobacter nasiphocae]|uniref:Uncharacterized protein n=1 Tax=Falsarthrobacter nasiphocae TaxID=189863 RepID=A0AAE3YIR7_9MICC|nr:hypothetical protein [Falsarthrobacter nasiphocae]MDR6892955.1 hypothetical protein [Falsarthrobacter nasiphocae]
MEINLLETLFILLWVGGVVLAGFTAGIRRTPLSYMVLLGAVCVPAVGTVCAAAYAVRIFTTKTFGQDALR